MTDINERINEATSAFRAGRKEEARDILMQVVDQDDSHERAWLLLSEVVDALEEKQICLENVLTINPGNARARQALEHVNQQLIGGAQGAGIQDDPAAGGSVFTTDAMDFGVSSGSSGSSPAAATGRSASSAPIGAEFESVSGDALLGGDRKTPGGGTIFGDPVQTNRADSPPPASPVIDDADAFKWPLPAQDEPASGAADDLIASSVDWGSGTGAATYGSGRDVDLPSPQEYDDWVQGLNLDGTAAPGAGSPAAGAAPPRAGGSGGSTTFDDTSFMMDKSFLDEPDKSPRQGGQAPGAFDPGFDFDADAASGGSDRRAQADDGPGLAFLGANLPFEGFDVALDDADDPDAGATPLDPPLFADPAGGDSFGDFGSLNASAFDHEDGAAADDMFSSAFTDSGGAFSSAVPEAGSRAGGDPNRDALGLYNEDLSSDTHDLELDDDDSDPFDTDTFAAQAADDLFASRLNTYVSPGAAAPTGASPARQPGTPVPTGATRAGINYLQYIPAEIDASGAGSSRGLLLLGGIVLLLMLNLASFVMLLTQL